MRAICRSLGHAEPPQLMVCEIDAQLRPGNLSLLSQSGGQWRSADVGPALPDLLAPGPTSERLLDAIARAQGGGLVEVELETRLAGLSQWERWILGPGPSGSCRASVRDLTASRNLLNQHRQLEERLAGILDNIADAVVVLSVDGVIETANLAAARLFDHQPDELIGLPVEALMDEPFRSAHQGYIDGYLRSGRSGILNVGPRPLPARRRDGAVVPIELSVGEVLIGGRRMFIGVCRDISERLRQEEALRRSNNALEARLADLGRLSADLERQTLESEALARAAEAARGEAEEASQAKSRFLATMSHELRTPLNGVLAVADLLAQRRLAAPERELLEIMRTSGQGLLGLLNEILDLARIEAGALVLSAEPFSVQRLLQGVAATWRVAAQAKGLDLVLEAVCEVDAVVGDAARLRQILSNLLSNAIKFTEAGRVTLWATCRPGAGGAVELDMAVEDTGVGIGQEDWERLFEPFVQGDSSASRRFGGSGLGLSICRELVSAMGGTILPEPGRSEGALFRVRLRLPAAPPGTGDVEPETEHAVRGGPHVLVAEDHPLNQKIIGLVLQGLGLQFAIVSDGAAAVEAVAGGGFDLVLMDLQMPGMDGLEATRAIRSLEGPCAGVPIVGVTANALPEHQQACREAGMNGFVSKPFRPDQIARAISAALAAGAEALGA